MATLDPWFVGFDPARSVAIQARKLGLSLEVGTATVTRREAFALRLDGTYSALGRSGEFRVDLQLLDADPKAVEGPCRLGLDGLLAFDGRYRVDGGRLLLSGQVDGKGRRVSLEARDGGTLIAGDLPATLLVVPAPV